MYQTDLQSNLATDEDRGQQRGEIIGQRRGEIIGERRALAKIEHEYNIQVAKKLLKYDLPAEQIADICRLTIDEVACLRAEL